MARFAKRTLMLGSFLALTACYHTITTTNLNPGVQRTEPWAVAFVYGLIPAKVDAGKACSGKPIQGVETQYSFLNWVVGAVTFGIFTPMTVTVTCAG